MVTALPAGHMVPSPRALFRTGVSVRAVRRHLPAALVVACLLASAAVAGAVPSGGETPQVGSGPTIHERTSFNRTPSMPGSVDATISYELPSSVAELEVTVRPGPWTGAEVVETVGFDRTGSWSFSWSDDQPADRPSIRVRLPLDGPVGAGDSPSAEGAERAAWALVPTVGLNTEARWRYFGESPDFEQSTAIEGQGVLTDVYAYLGPHRTVEAGTGNGSVEVVVVGKAEPAASPDRVAGFLARQQERFDLGARRPATALVLPNDSVATTAPIGQTAGRTFWVRDTSFELESVENTPAHEFIHTRMGGVGNGSALWLREASAQYYGMLLSLNDGIGSYDQFERRVGAAPTTTDSVRLARPSTFADNDGEYVVGARVLAALDARIRQRTGGQRTLVDVFRNGTDPETGFVAFESAEAFREAVVRVSGDPELGTWLNRYTTTTERPSVPDDPSLFVTEPTLDPDGDGIESGTEVERGTNPFDADSDHDGLEDDREQRLGTDARAADTDGDGLTDGTEVERGLDPTAADTDGDGVDDGEDAYPADASRTAAATEPGDREGETDTGVIWSVIGLWLLGGLAGLAAVVVAGARVVHRLSGTGARVANGPLLKLVLVAVGAGVLSIVVLVLSGW